MARTKLRGVKLSEVSFVGKGDNKGAHILLVKNAPIVELGKDYKGRDKAKVLQKWFDDDVSKADGVFKEEEAEMFADLLADKTIRDQVWSMVWMLEDSICSIMNNETSTNKGELIATTVEQFREAITSLTKNEEEEEPMAKTVAELEKEVADLTKERDDLKKQNETLTTEKTDVEKERDELKKAQEPETKIDKSKLPAEVRKQMDDQEAELRKQREDIEKMKDDTLTNECVSLAKEIPFIGSEGIVVSDVLKSIKKSLPDAFAHVTTLLKTADARLKESGLFKENGRNDDPNAATGSAYDKLVAKAKELQKADGTISFEKAFDKVYAQEHDLRKEYNAGR